MNKKSIRVPTQIRCRWLDRLVAHTNMKRAGLQHVNKHDYSTYKSMTGMTVMEYQPSYFSRHWRDTVDVVSTNVRRKKNG